MSAREKILGRLRQRRQKAELSYPAEDNRVVTERQWQLEERLDRFQSNLESVHGEVHRVKHGDWIKALSAILQQKGTRNLLAPQCHEIGQALRNNREFKLPALLSYDQPIEGWRKELFNDVDAAITSTRGGIAETGSLILWPTPDEPRLMSLVPPLHIAIVDADKIQSTFHETLTTQHWAQAMPTNALLISGPSKTADIEQTLAYGVHGPRELLVLIRMP